MKRITPDLREWWGRCHWQENSEAKTVSPCHRRTWKNIFSFWIFMNIFSSMQTQNGFLWTFLALWKHNIKRIWRLWWLWPKNHFAKWKEILWMIFKQKLQLLHILARSTVSRWITYRTHILFSTFQILNNSIQNLLPRYTYAWRLNFSGGGLLRRAFWI